jgi:hypothetical protein
LDYALTAEGHVVHQFDQSVFFPIPPSAFKKNRFDFTVFGLCIDGPVPPKDAQLDSGLDFVMASL